MVNNLNILPDQPNFNDEWEQFETPRNEYFEEHPEFGQQYSPDESIETTPPQSKEVFEDNWNNFQSPESMDYQNIDESGLEWFGRNATSGLVSAGSSYLGKYGDIQELIEQVTINYPAITTGLMGLTIKSLVGEDKWKDLILGGRNPDRYSDLSPEERKKAISQSGEFKFPSSQATREFADKYIGDYIKPKTKNEEQYQELMSDIGSLGKLKPKGMSWAKYGYNMLGIPFSANAVKSLADTLGFSEFGSQVAKAVSTLALSIGGNVDAKAYLSKKANNLRKTLPNTNPIDWNKFSNNLKKSVKKMIPGDEASKDALSQYGSIIAQMENGQNSLGDLITRYDAINRVKNSRGMFDLGKSSRKLATENLDKIRLNTKEAIKNSINDPKKFKEWEDLQRSFAVMHESQKITRKIANLARSPEGKVLAGPVGALFGLSTYTSPALTGFVPAAGYGIYKTGQVAYRIYSDPQLAKYYWNSLNAVANDNFPLFLKEYKKLNNSYEKKYKPSRQEKSKRQT